MNAEDRIDQIVQRLAAEMKQLAQAAGTGRPPAGMLEYLLRERLWHFGARFLEVLWRQAETHLLAGRPVQDRPQKRFLSLFGEVEMPRARCRLTPAGWQYPLDEALGIDGQAPYTATVQELLSLLAVQESFATVAGEVDKLLGLKVSAKSIQRTAESAGQRAEQQLAQEAAAALAGQPPPPVAEPARDTLVVAMDGVQAPHRDGWHEVKLATVFPNEARCRQHGGRRVLTRKGYLATVESAAGFGQRLWAQACRWGADQVGRLVVMGDGAKWIWNLADEHFPQGLQILDFYHAAEHLWKFAEQAFGDRQQTAATRSWARRYVKYLKRGRVDLVLEAMGRVAGGQRPKRSAAAQQALEGQINYVQENRHRMDYPAYRRQGLPIGTGVVEGSCKFVVQARFKKPGARWSRPGLAALLALKQLWLNQEWNSFWPHLAAA